MPHQAVMVGRYEDIVNNWPGSEVELSLETSDEHQIKKDAKIAPLTPPWPVGLR